MKQTNNYAEQLIKETQPEQEDWNAENFQNWLYPKSYSGSSNEVKDQQIPLLSPSFYELPETSFKFNYKNKQKDPLEELGIEVLR